VLHDCIRYLRPVQTYAAGIVGNFGDVIENVIDIISQFFPAAKETLRKLNCTFYAYFIFKKWCGEAFKCSSKSQNVSLTEFSILETDSYLK